jgi:TonB family protein
MVRFLSFILILFITLPLFCQINCDTIFGPRWYDPPIFEHSKIEGWDKFFEFLQTNLIYPETAKEDKVEGQVFVAFWVDTNGYTSEHTIVKSVRQDLDDEVLRVAKLIKFDVPAKNVNGKPIGICYQVPFRFTLDDEKKALRKSKTKICKGGQSGNP